MSNGSKCPTTTAVSIGFYVACRLRVTAQELPQPLHAVGIHLRIDADDGNVFRESLGDEQPIEWVFVVRRHRGEQCRMLGFDWQNVEIVGRDLRFHERSVWLRQGIFTESDFDR